MHPHAPRPTDPDVKQSYKELSDAPHPYMGYNDRLPDASDAFTGYGEHLPGHPDFPNTSAATYGSREGGLGDAPDLWTGSYRDRLPDAPDVVLGYQPRLPDAPDKVVKFNRPGAGIADAPDEVEDAGVTEAPPVPEARVSEAPQLPGVRPYTPDPAPPSRSARRFSPGSRYSIPFAGQTRLQTSWTS